MVLKFIDTEEGAPCSGFNMESPDGSSVQIAWYPQEYSRLLIDHIAVIAFDKDQTFGDGVELTNEAAIEFYHRLGNLLGLSNLPRTGNTCMTEFREYYGIESYMKGFVMEKPKGSAIAVYLTPGEHRIDERDNIVVWGYYQDDEQSGRGIDMDRPEAVEMYHRLGDLLGLEG
jgi:hypothetical protein